VVGQPSLEREQRDREHDAPGQDADERTNNDEAPEDERGEQAKAKGDLDHLLARPALLKSAQRHVPPSVAALTGWPIEAHRTSGLIQIKHPPPSAVP
jgi:hypothetical protein